MRRGEDVGCDGAMARERPYMVLAAKATLRVAAGRGRTGALQGAERGILQPRVVTGDGRRARQARQGSE